MAMSLTGGKRKVNKSLKAWVSFVKRVQKEEKLSYKDAIHRAKVRKDKGEKWMSGGDGTPMPEEATPLEEDVTTPLEENDATPMNMDFEETDDNSNDESLKTTLTGGRRRRRTMRRSRSRGRSRSIARSRGRSRRRSSRRH